MRTGRDGWTDEGSIRGPRGPKNSGCARRCQHFHMVRKMGSDGRELFRARTSVAEACLWWHPDGESRRASPPVAASLTASSVAHTETETERETLRQRHTLRGNRGVFEALLRGGGKFSQRCSYKEIVIVTNLQYLQEEVT